MYLLQKQPYGFKDRFGNDRWPVGKNKIVNFANQSC